MRSMTVVVAALAVAAVSSRLAAQQPAHRNAPAHGALPHQGMAGMQGMGGMMDSMMGPMMQAMAITPEHLLMQKDKLHLTAPQTQRLTAIRDSAKSGHDQAASQAAMHLREMTAAMHAAQPDSNAIRTHFNAAFRFMQAAHWSMVKAATQAWPVLTAAQQHDVEADAANCCGGMMGGSGMDRH